MLSISPSLPYNIFFSDFQPLYDTLRGLGFDGPALLLPLCPGEVNDPACPWHARSPGQVVGGPPPGSLGSTWLACARRHPEVLGKAQRCSEIFERKDLKTKRVFPPPPLLWKYAIGPQRNCSLLITMRSKKSRSACHDLPAPSLVVSTFIIHYI